MKHVFIIGSRGYEANYGGWETFVTNLVNNYNDKKTIFHISGLGDTNKEIKINNNLYLNNFYIPQNGGLKMLICTIKAFNYYLEYIKKNNLDNTYLYILGLKLGPILSLKKKKLNSLNIKVLVNPDGLEHKRSKWSYPVRKFFLLSEKWMLESSDTIICDALGIKDYIDNKYPKLKKKTKYIAYGTNKVDINNITNEEILDKYNIKKDDYVLMVGRFVPENNYELVLNEFMKSTINKKLVIVSNISSSNYYNDVTSKTSCLKDKRIVFIDGIYDEKELSIVRKNALCYIHGHSVGGTNPSLLEALSLTDINILYDVCFNKDVGGDSCLYFKSNGTLTSILDNIDSYDKKTLGNMARKIIKNNFTWDIIVSKYKEIFK